MKYSLYTKIVLAFVFCITLTATHSAYAQDKNLNSHQNLIDEIVAKFNLNKKDVQSFVETQHTKRRENFKNTMQKRFEERLTKLVQEGKITDVQKTAVMQKHTELQLKKEQMHNDMHTWLKSQGIDPTLLQPMGGKMRMHK